MVSVYPTYILADNNATGVLGPDKHFNTEASNELEKIDKLWLP